MNKYISKQKKKQKKNEKNDWQLRCNFRGPAAMTATSPKRRTWPSVAKVANPKLNSGTSMCVDHQIGRVQVAMLHPKFVEMLKTCHGITSEKSCAGTVDSTLL